MISLGWRADLKLSQVFRGFVAPGREVGVHAGDESGELGMSVDSGFDRGFFDGEIDIAGAVGLEKRLAEFGADGPVGWRASMSAAGMPPLRWASMSWRSSGVWLSM